MKIKSKNPNHTHCCEKQLVNEAIDAASIEKAKVMFNAILDQIKFSHNIENVHLKIFGVVSTGAYPIDSVKQ